MNWSCDSIGMTIGPPQLYSFAFFASPLPFPIPWCCSALIAPVFAVGRSPFLPSVHLNNLNQSCCKIAAAR